VKKRMLITGCALGAGIALFADALVVLMIHNVWRIAQALAGEYIGAVLHQLTEAEITLPWLVSLAGFAVIAAVWMLLRNHRALRIVSVILLAFVCLAATFLTTAVNDVPMHIAIKALVALVRSGMI